MDDSRVGKSGLEDTKELKVRRRLVSDARCTGSEGPEQREIILSRSRYVVRGRAFLSRNRVRRRRRLLDATRGSARLAWCPIGACRR
jgi:hypothetical protein